MDARNTHKTHSANENLWWKEWNSCMAKWIKCDMCLCVFHVVGKLVFPNLDCHRKFYLFSLSITVFICSVHWSQLKHIARPCVSIQYFRKRFGMANEDQKATRSNKFKLNEKHRSILCDLSVSLCGENTFYCICGFAIYKMMFCRSTSFPTKFLFFFFAIRLSHTLCAIEPQNIDPFHMYNSAYS